MNQRTQKYMLWSYLEVFTIIVFNIIASIYDIRNKIGFSLINSRDRKLKTAIMGHI